MNYLGFHADVWLRGLFKEAGIALGYWIDPGILLLDAQLKTLRANTAKERRLHPHVQSSIPPNRQGVGGTQVSISA